MVDEATPVAHVPDTGSIGPGNAVKALSRRALGELKSRATQQIGTEGDFQRSAVELFEVWTAAAEFIHKHAVRTYRR